jgi:hypothetical protein
MFSSVLIFCWSHKAHVESARCACRAARAAAPVDCGAEEDKVGSQHGLHNGQRDGRGLIDYKKLCLPQPLVVLRLDVLHSLQTYAKLSSL